MAETSFFWNGTTIGDAAIAPYDSDELNGVLRAMTGATAASYQSGVFKHEGGPTLELALSMATNSATISAGRAQVHGTAYVSTTPVPFSIPSANSTTRQDRIALRKVWADQQVRLIRIAGTEGVGPAVPTNVEGVIWDMLLFTVQVNSLGVVTLVTDHRQYLPRASTFGETTLPSVTSIPNLVLSAYTLNLISMLNFLTTAPALVSVPTLNYNGLTGLVPPMVSLWITPSMSTLPPVETDDLVVFNARRVDTTNGAMWSSTTNPSRVYAPLTGLYVVSANLMVTTHISIGLDIVFKIRKNGATLLCTDQAPIHSGASAGVRNTQRGSLHPTVINLTAGDYIELLLDHVGNGSPLWSTPLENMFNLQYVGARTSAVIGSIIS